MLLDVINIFVFKKVKKKFCVWFLFFLVVVLYGFFVGILDLVGMIVSFYVERVLVEFVYVNM